MSYRKPDVAVHRRLRRHRPYRCRALYAWVLTPPKFAELQAKVSAVLQMLITKYPDAAFGPFDGKNGRAGAVYFRAYQ